MDDGEANRRSDPPPISVFDESATWGKRGVPQGQTITPRDVLIFVLVVLAFVAWVWLLVWAF